MISNGIIIPLEKPSSQLLANWYAEQVVKGNIIAPIYIKKACEMHLIDLKRESDPTFRWRFDEEKGHRPIKFIEKFCKPSKGDFNRMIMQPWQHFAFGLAFGWVDKEKGLRRYKEVLIFMARKNGKSTMISGASLYGASKDGERGADVMLLANSKQQANVVFDEAKAMVKSSPDLRSRFRPRRDAIHFDRTFSKIAPLASDSEKLDGFSTHIGNFDEIHEFKDYKLINVIKNSRGARKQPLLFYITTAGYQLNGPLVTMIEQGKDTLDRLIENERTLYLLYSLDDEDDINDSSNWVKANPNLGVSPRLEDMEEEWNSAKRVPDERADFICKRFNIFVDNSQQSFIDLQRLKRNNQTIDFDSLIGKSCIAGYDLSETEDFTSAALEFMLDTGEVAVLTHSWVPQRKVELSNEKINYKDWEEKGYLTIVPGEYIDYKLVYNWLLKMNKLYPIELITYDDANAFVLNQQLVNDGFETQKVRQGGYTLNDPLKDLNQRFIDGNVIHNNNEMFNWYVNNVKIIKDSNGNWKPTKQNRYRKIDGFAAFLNAHSEMYKKAVAITEPGEIETISVNDLLS